MTNLNNASDLESLYGPLYKFSDAKRGDTIRFRDSEFGIIEGVVLWVIGPGPIAATDMPAYYIVDAKGDFPETVFPSDVIASRPGDEPTLQKCPYCNGLHPAGQVKSCPLNPNKRGGDGLPLTSRNNSHPDENRWDEELYDEIEQAESDN